MKLKVNKKKDIKRLKSVNIFERHNKKRINNLTKKVNKCMHKKFK